MEGRRGLGIPVHVPAIETCFMSTDEIARIFSKSQGEEFGIFPKSQGLERSSDFKFQGLERSSEFL